MVDREGNFPYTQYMNTRQILKKINCPYLELVKGDGYWYFVYDEPAREVYETRSVYTMYLNDMTLEQWVEEGKALVAECAPVL